RTGQIRVVFEPGPLKPLHLKTIIVGIQGRNGVAEHRKSAVALPVGEKRLGHSLTRFGKVLGIRRRTKNKAIRPSSFVLRLIESWPMPVAGQLAPKQAEQDLRVAAL